jgi:hypothetical protein
MVRRQSSLDRRFHEVLAEARVQVGPVAWIQVSGELSRRSYRLRPGAP